MKRLIFALGFIIFFPNLVCARTIGSVSEDAQYRAVDGVKPLYGFLSIAIYNSSYTSDREISAASKYDVKINDYLISTIRQDSNAVKSGVGNFSYLRVELPNGHYKVQISKPDVFSSSDMNSFEVIVKESKEISVVVRNEIPKVVPNVLIRGFSAIPSAEVFDKQYEKLVNSAEASALEVRDSFIAQTQKREAEKNRHAAEMKVFAMKAREEEARREESKVNANIEAQKEEEKERLELAKKKEQERLEAEDDKTCKSFGAKSGTHPYMACRVSLINSRNERVERQAAIKQLENKLESLQGEIAKQESRRSFEAARLEQQRQESEAIQQQRWNEEKARRDKALRLEQAQRAFEAAAAMSQTQPSGQTGGNFPFQNYNINGRMWNCNTIGNITNCR